MLLASYLHNFLVTDLHVLIIETFTAFILVIFHYRPQ
jgi:hypothetical protein